MFTDSHESETVKASIHGAALAIVMELAVYNTVAYGRRRERHLLVNCCTYWGFVGYEIYQIWRHTYGRVGQVIGPDLKAG